MSTGLTWVTITDTSSSSPDIGTSQIQFGDYNEAYDYGNWYMRLANTQFPFASQIFVCIYTKSPNQSGIWYVSGGVVTWLAID